METSIIVDDDYKSKSHVRKRTVKRCEKRRIRFTHGSDGGPLMFRYDDGLKGRVESVCNSRDVYQPLPDDTLVITLASYTPSKDKTGLYHPRLTLRCTTASGRSMRVVVVNPRIARLRSVQQLIGMTVTSMNVLLHVHCVDDDKPDHITLIAEKICLGKPFKDIQDVAVVSDKRLVTYQSSPKLATGAVIWSEPDIHMMLPVDAPNTMTRARVNSRPGTVYSHPAEMFVVVPAR